MDSEDNLKDEEAINAADKEESHKVADTLKTTGKVAATVGKGIGKGLFALGKGIGKFVKGGIEGVAGSSHSSNTNNNSNINLLNSGKSFTHLKL